MKSNQLTAKLQLLPIKPNQPSPLMSMDAAKRLDWQVNEKCGNRIVKVILERIRIQVSGSGKNVNESHEACSSPKIILKNLNGRLWDARHQSSESSLCGNRPRRNKTKNYTQYFETGSVGSDSDDESNFGADTSTSELGPRNTSDAESESAFSSNTERIINNLKTTSTNLDLDVADKVCQNNDHSSTAKKLKAARYPKVACSICNLLISKKHMRKHFKRKHPEDNLQWQCALCPFECTTQRWLQHHILEVHVVDKPFECGFCLKSFMTKKLLTQHNKRTHADKHLSCDLCPTKLFIDSASYTKHLETVHRSNNTGATSNNLLCPVCETWFLTEADLAKHFNKPESISVMKCKFCSKTVYTPCRLNLHRQKMHSDTPKAETCIEHAQIKTVVKPTAAAKTHSETISRISASVQNQVSSNTFFCIVCFAIFTRWSDLELHELKEKHRRWKCPICLKLFILRRDLKRHIQAVHSDARPFLCTDKGCSKSFKEMRVLKNT